MEKHFKSLLTTAQKYKEDISIFYIANIKNKTRNYSDYQSASVSAEFLTEDNYARIVNALKKQGFDIKCYFDEEDFIKECVLNNYFKSYHKKIIVLNSSQKGTHIGRKSLIPAFCDLLGFWYAGSNAYVTSLARDKFKTNCILDNLGMVCARSYLYMPQNGWLFGEHPPNNMKVISKLNYEASSIGLTHENLFRYNSQNDTFINKLALEYSQPIIVQEFIEGCEVEFPFIKTNKLYETFPVRISINNNKEMGNEILTYDIRKERKYYFTDYRSHQPAICKELAECSKKVITALGLEGLCRVDFRIRNNSEYFITDIATNPGYTEVSSVKFAFSTMGFSYEQIISMLIGATIQKYNGGK